MSSINQLNFSTPRHLLAYWNNEAKARDSIDIVPDEYTDRYSADSSGTTTINDFCPNLQDLYRGYCV